MGLVAGANRRVPGLRRTEVATLAGVSVEYYARLERGNLAGVSQEVLDSLSRALELDDAERAHLLDLASAASSKPARRKRAQHEHVRDSLRATLDAITAVPAVVNNGRGDLIAANALARAFYSEMFVQSGRRPVNHARFVFLDPRAVTFYRDWSKVADELVAILRTEAGRDPYDRALTDLVGELSTQSEEFRTAVGSSQRPSALHRYEARAAPSRRRPRPDIRGIRHSGRHRTDPCRLHGAAGFHAQGRPFPACQLGRHSDPPRGPGGGVGCFRFKVTHCIPLRTIRPPTLLSSTARGGCGPI